MTNDNTTRIFVPAAEAVCDVEIPGVCSWNPTDEDDKEGTRLLSNPEPTG